MVLFGYEAIFIAPNRPKPVNNTQSIDVKEVRTDSPLLSNIPANKQETPTNQQIKPEIYKIETPIVHTELSNVGGTLHNIEFSGSKAMPLTDLVAVKGFSSLAFAESGRSKDGIAYELTTNNVRISKTFKKLDDHTFLAFIEISNLNKISNLENIAFNAFTIDTSIIAHNNQETMLDEYSVLSASKAFRKSSAFQFNAKEDKNVSGMVKWAGFRDHYSAVLVRPEFETKGYEIKAVSKDRLDMVLVPKASFLAPGAKASYTFTIFAGPQDIVLMKKYNKDFEKIVAFFNLGAMDAVAKGVYWSGVFIQKIVKSWGMTIILISVLFYGLTYPLTFKSMMSMRKMQAAQPKINALREKYKSDPKKLNAEVIEIYRREKINPLGGCLPMLLQMPVFMAMYQVLWRAYYFQGKGFLWIKDLSQPDRLFILPFQLPFLGNELNILPILMGAVMFVQQKLSAKTMVATDQTQAMQQKMMTVFFPVFIGFIFYKFASGLSLYFTMFYLFSAVTQWKMTKVKV